MFRANTLSLKANLVLKATSKQSLFWKHCPIFFEDRQTDLQTDRQTFHETRPRCFLSKHKNILIILFHCSRPFQRYQIWYDNNYLNLTNSQARLLEGVVLVALHRVTSRHVARDVTLLASIGPITGPDICCRRGRRRGEEEEEEKKKKNGPSVL